MSSSSIQKFRESDSLVPERERIKQMIFDLEKDEVEKLGDILSEDTYVKPKHLLDLSLDEGGDKKKKKPKAVAPKKDRKLKPGTGQNTGLHSLIDIENHRNPGTAKPAQDVSGFLEQDPLADLQSSSQLSTSMTVDSIIEEALETQTDRQVTSSPKSPEELLREALEKSKLNLDPAITAKLSGGADAETTEDEPQPGAKEATLSDEDLALLDELEINAEESAQLLDMDAEQPLEEPQLNSGEPAGLSDVDAGMQYAQQEEMNLVDDLGLIEPEADITENSNAWKYTLDNSVYLDDEQSALEFAGAKELMICGDILEALNRFRHVCLTSSHSHYTLLAYLELKKQDQDTQELIDQMIEKEKEMILLLETAKGEDDE